MPRVNTLAVFALALLVPFAAMAGDEIVEVRTLDELQRVKPVALAGGGEIRLGLAESGPDGGPWKLLYGLVKSGDAGNDIQSSRGNRQPLGPVFYTVKPPLALEARAKLEVAKDLRNQARHADGQDLFCARVLTALPGKYELKVHDAEGRVVQKKTFEVSRVRSAYWLELAGPDDREMTQRPSASVPKFDGSEAIAQMNKERLWFGGASFRLADLAKVANKAPLANDLPGGIPLEGRLEGVFNRNKSESGKTPFPLLLGMDGDELVVQSVAIDLDEIDDGPGTFLVRWWLNGQPVLPERLREAKSDEAKPRIEQQAKKMEEEEAVTERRWSFNLPPIFKSLRVGDHVRMQLLFCPQGSELFSEAASGGGDEMLRSLQEQSGTSPPVPVLSNPLELVISDANLVKPKARVRPGQPKLQPLKEPK